MPLYRSFTAVLKNWKEEIINSCDRPYNSHKQSNSLAEYYNGRIGEVIDRANGLVNFERTRARLLYMFNKSVNYSLSKDFSSYKTKGKKRVCQEKCVSIFLIHVDTVRSSLFNKSILQIKPGSSISEFPGLFL